MNNSKTILWNIASMAGAAIVAVLVFGSGSLMENVVVDFNLGDTYFVTSIRNVALGLFFVLVLVFRVLIFRVLKRWTLPSS
ncbi:MAG: hypothetical protein SchgKO_10970 [Schleiferiaceae bacterium]